MTAGIGAGSLFTGTAPVGAAPLLAPGHRAGRHGPAVVRDWYATLYSGIMDAGITPPPAARLYAYVGVAAFEAVVEGAPGHRSLAGQLNGSRPVGKAGDPNAVDWPIVISAAIGTVAAMLLPDASDAFTTAMDDQLHLHLDERGSAGVSGRRMDRSLARGRRVGEHIAGWAATDGAAATVGRTYAPPVGPSLWRSTPPNFGTAIDPHWGTVRPFALPSAAFCAPPPPIAFNTSPDSDFYHEALAVIAATEALTDEDRAISLFWRDNPITSGLPAGHWMLLAGQLADERGLDLVAAAELHAVAGLTLADAFTSCWHEKYVTNLLRPISYIRSHVPGRDSWSSFVNTPQFPEYTSGHSVASAAVAGVLTHHLGVFPFTDRTHQLRNPGLGTRSFASFDAAAAEAANSRLLGGIHYPMGIDAGLDQGRHVGTSILERVSTKRQDRR